MSKFLHVSFFESYEIPYHLFLPDNTRFIKIELNSKLPVTIEQLERDYTPDTLIMIDDQQQGGNMGLFGRGYQLALSIRTAKEKTLFQRAQVLIIGKFNLYQYLHQHPEHIFIMSPGIQYISFLNNDFKYFPFYKSDEISAVELTKTHQYLLGRSIFKQSFDRHLAASNFGMNIIFIFVEFILEALKDYHEYNEFYAKFINSVIDNSHDPELNIAIFNFRQRFLADTNNTIKAEKDKINQFISSIRNNLHQNDLKIALIDDESVQMRKSQNGNTGWKHAIASLIFSDTSVIYDVNQYIEKPINKNNFEKIVEQIETNNIGCILLDVHLNPNNNKKGIENKTGTLLLQRLRLELPTVPIIIITATNKPWKHRYLINKGADAVWVKEGIDEGRSTKASYYNVIRLLQLLKRVTSSKYQFLFQLGNEIKELKNENNSYWWTQSPICWNNGNIHYQNFFDKNTQTYLDQLKAEHHPDYRTEVSNCLRNIQQLLRIYLLQTELQFNEATGGSDEEYRQRNITFDATTRDSSIAKVISEALVIQIGKVIEIIHGQRWMDQQSSYRLSAAIIGGRKHKTPDYGIVRGDWIAYWLYQHRNECAHYFEDIKLVFYNNVANPDSRSLATLFSVLIAYLKNSTQPYHSYNSKYLELCNSNEPNRKVDAKFIDSYLRGSQHRLESQEFLITYQKLLSIVKPDD